MKIYKIFFTFFLTTLFSCSANDEVSLDMFADQSDVFESGKSLTSLTFGLHELEDKKTSQKELLIGIHGGRSRGYEWIYPLQTLDQEINQISFFRWDDTKCPDSSISSLLKLIKTKLVEEPNLESIILIGHSYGALLATMFIEKWDLAIPLEVHSIAGPLKGIDALSKLCNFKIPKDLKVGIDLYEWRTIQELDGAFREFEFDPQNVEIKGSQVTRLPETYKGNKLGHNWSVSWVADEISQAE